MIFSHKLIFMKWHREAAGFVPGVNSSGIRLLTWGTRTPQNMHFSQTENFPWGVIEFYIHTINTVSKSNILDNADKTKNRKARVLHIAEVIAKRFQRFFGSTEIKCLSVATSSSKDVKGK